MPVFLGMIGDETATTVFAENEDKALSMVRQNLLAADDGFVIYERWARQGGHVEEYERRTPDKD